MLDPRQVWGGSEDREISRESGPMSLPAPCCEKVGGLPDTGAVWGAHLGGSQPSSLLIRQDTLTSHVLSAKLWDQGPIRARKGSWFALVFSHSRTFYELSGGGSH